MKNAVSSIGDILAALPAARATVRKEIRARIDAGEKIASMSDTEMRERSKEFVEGALPSNTIKKSAA